MPNRIKLLKPLYFWNYLIPRTRKSWAILLGSLIALYLLIWFALPFAFPYQPQALTGERQSLIVLDRNGEILHHKSREDYFRLIHTDLDDLPQDLINATLAAEDKRFFDHGGVDFLAICRATKDGISAGKMVGGASTITQQTVKLSSGTPPRNFKTKFIEAFTARHLELTSDKDTILESYFNHLDYGNHMLGPKQAALHYFGRPLDQLSLGENALLAGLPQSPTRHNPRINPRGAKKRRDWVLDRMQIVYEIDAERIQRAKDEPITLQAPRYQTNAPQITALIESKSELHHGDIQSTIDPKLQNFTREKINAELTKLEKKNVKNGAVVVIDNRTREIIALVGTRDFQSTESGQINAALIPRSPGSVLKPLGYILAFDELRMQPSTIIPDIETSYGGKLGADEYVNYSRTHSGPVTIYHALGNSLNIPIVRIINQMGGPSKLLKLYRQIGFENLTEPANNYGLSLAIGSGEVSLLDATNAFATISQMGKHTNSVIFKGQEQKKAQQIFSADSAYLITSILSDNSARTAAFGTQSNLRFSFPCAVKTGTSTDFRDNWCIGFTKDYTVGVWVGNLDNTPMRGITGVSGAGPIFHAVMRELHRTKKTQWYKKPSTITEVTIDPHTGKQLTPENPRYHLGIRTLAPLSNQPPIASESDYDIKGRVYLNNTYSKWLEKNPQRPFAPNKLALATKNLRIITPSHQSRFLLDPDLPSNGKYLTLKSNSANKTKWISDTLEITLRNNHPTATLKPGKHKLTVIDGYTKEEETIEFTVQSL